MSTPPLCPLGPLPQCGASGEDKGPGRPRGARTELPAVGLPTPPSQAPESRSGGAQSGERRRPVPAACPSGGDRWQLPGRPPPPTPHSAAAVTFTPAPSGAAALTQHCPSRPSPRGPTPAALQGKAGPPPAAGHRARPGQAPPGVTGTQAGGVKGTGGRRGGSSPHSLFLDEHHGGAAASLPPGPGPLKVTGAFRRSAGPRRTGTGKGRGGGRGGGNRGGGSRGGAFLRQRLRHGATQACLPQRRARGLPALPSARSRRCPAASARPESAAHPHSPNTPRSGFAARSVRDYGPLPAGRRADSAGAFNPGDGSGPQSDRVSVSRGSGSPSLLWGLHPAKSS